MTNKKSSSNNIEALARQAKLTSLCSGWNLNSLHKENLSDDSLFFYMTNSNSSKDLWVCSIPRTAFNIIIESGEKIDVNGAAGAVSKYFDLIADKKSSSLQDNENTLGLALSIYLSKTKTFESAKNNKDVRHFCFIRYKKTNQLRPFAMNGSGFSFLVADDILGAFQSVLEIDKRNHPEWN